MNSEDGTKGDPRTIHTLIEGDYTPQRQLRKSDKDRLATSKTILESSYADLIEFVDGEMNDPYFIVKDEDEEVQAQAFEVFKFVHHYLAALYSFNEAVRVSVSAYLPEDVKLTKTEFEPENISGIEYTRRLKFLRGLRVAAQHGAFNDCLFIDQWDKESDKYRLMFSKRDFCQHERLSDAGAYVRHTNKNRIREPLRYIQSFHKTNLDPFYQDCLTWFETY